MRKPELDQGSLAPAMLEPTTPARGTTALSFYSTVYIGGIELADTSQYY